MRRLVALVGVLAVAILGATGATAGPTAGGFATDNVEYVGFIPTEQATSTGAAFVRKHMYLTSWKNISIYDISDPTQPELVGTAPLGFQFENEDVAVSPNGKTLLFSESLPQDILHVWDVSDKANPEEIAQVEGAGDHTATCILKCKWVYGSDGSVVDLRKRKSPEKADLNWHQAVGLQGGAHDVEEFKKGFILVSSISAPLMVVKVRNPLKPKVMALGEHPDPQGFLFHSGRWPRKGRDKFMLMQGERNAQPRCHDSTGPFMTFSTDKWKKTHTVKLIDTYRLPNGTYQDGAPAVSVLGCSAHWFDEHPKFKNGGLVALGYYEHGTRFLHLTRKGKIREVGYFLPYGGSTSVAHWVTKKLVYAVDYTRGVDILRFNGAEL